MEFDELYHTYVDSVYGYLLFKLNSKQLAEDLLQETFLAVYKQLKQEDTVITPRAWILSIAHHKMVDYLRKKVHLEQPTPLEQMPPIWHEESSNIIVEEFLDQLDDLERTIIYGLYILGLSCAELGLILQIPEGTVKSKAYYARKRLRNWLQEE